MPELSFVNQVGAREDLADLIHITDAKSTPLTSAANKGKEPINPLFSWQADSFKEPSFDGVMDNEDAKDFSNPAEERCLLEGRIQKFWRKPKVSDFAESVSDVAGLGRKKEMARAIKKDMEHLKRDIESAICSDHESRKQGNGRPNLGRGLGQWLTATAQTDLPVDATQLCPTGSVVTTALSAITDDTIQDFLQSMYLKVGKPIDYLLLCGPALKRRFTKFTQTQFGSTNVPASIRTYGTLAGDKRIVESVDIFEGDCGTLTLMLSLFLAKDNADPLVGLRRGYAIDPDNIEIGYNRRPRYVPLQDGGGGPRGILDAIVGWKLLSPLGFGKIDPATV